MRILYVITKANFGGAQRYVYDLARAAQTSGHEVAVAMGGTGLLGERLASAGIRVIPLPLRQHRSFLRTLFTPGALFALIRLLRTERPEVVHVNSAKASGLGALAGRFARIPRIIFTAHGWEFNAPRPFFSRLGIRLFSWLTVLLSDRTICVSEAIRRDMAGMPFARRKLLVIHNGIACATGVTRAQARERFPAAPPGARWIGMLSELHPTKRVDDAVKAMQLVLARHPEAFLVVMGEGPERARLEQLISGEGLARRVLLAGFKEDGAALLSAFDIFMHSSQSEALGYAILEAGCASLPVVATDVGGIPEVIPDEAYGLLVPARNPHALAGALTSLLDDPVRAAKLGARLHARVVAEFPKEKMVRETFAAYRR